MAWIAFPRFTSSKTELFIHFCVVVTNSTDMKLLRLALRRMASPFPQEYAPAELNPQLIEETPDTDHD